MNNALLIKIGVGAIGGLITAAKIDFDAFKAWKSWANVLQYDWRLASFRWFQGAVIGGAAAATIDQVLIALGIN